MTVASANLALRRALALVGAARPIRALRSAGLLRADEMLPEQDLTALKVEASRIAEIRRARALAARAPAEPPNRLWLALGAREHARLVARNRAEAQAQAQAEEAIARARRCAQSALRAAGFERETTTASGSSYYWRSENGKRVRVRVSDHALPATDERVYNREQGWSCCEREIIYCRTTRAGERRAIGSAELARAIAEALVGQLEVAP